VPITGQPNSVSETVSADLDKIRVIYQSEWCFAGSGHREGEALWAEATREQVGVARAIKERQSPAS
jgi:hypothetical protein